MTLFDRRRAAFGAAMPMRTGLRPGHASCDVAQPNRHSEPRPRRAA